jgi:hypothetical protein
MIVAFAGKMGSGKDTAGEVFVERFDFKRIAFADNLKRMAQVVFGLSYEQCYDRDAKVKEFDKPIILEPSHAEDIINYVMYENNWELNKEQIVKLHNITGSHAMFKSPREALQFLGTEILRDCIHPDYHAEVVKKIIDKNGWEDVVITDCRFPNERVAVERWKGVSVLIERPINEEEGGGINNHASENSLGTKDDYTYTIQNDYTIDAFKGKVTALASYLKDC